MDAAACEEIKCKTFLPRMNGHAPYLARSCLSFGSHIEGTVLLWVNRVTKERSGGGEMDAATRAK